MTTTILSITTQTTLPLATDGSGVPNFLVNITLR
jgi:hypothetical protein